MDQEDFVKNLKRLASSAYIVLIGIFISKAIFYVYRVTIARHYGPDVYGTFALSTMIAGLFITFSTLGLSEGLLRFIPIYLERKQKGNLSHLWRFTFKTLIFSSLLSAAILFVGSEYISTRFFHAPELIPFLKLIALALPFGVLSTPLLSTLLAYGKISEYSKAFNIWQNLTRIVLVIPIVFLSLEDYTLALSYGAGYLVMFLVSLKLVRRLAPEVFKKEQMSDVEKSRITREVLGYSIPLILFGVVNVISFWTDSLFLGYFKSTVEVGIYNAAVPIASLLLITTQLFSQAFFPIVNRYYSKNSIGIVRDLSKQIGKWIFMINLPASLLLFLFPGVALNLLFGSEFLGASEALRILVVGNFALSIASVSNQVISMVGRSKTLMFNVLFTTGLNIVLNILLIPAQTIFSIDNSTGIVGAAFATSISLIVLSGIYLFQSNRFLLIIPIRRKVVNSVLAVSIPLVLLLAARRYIELGIAGIFVGSGLFLILYLSLLFLFGACDKNDWQVISEGWNTFKRELLGSRLFKFVTITPKNFS